jgi:hypothetical protein
MSLPPWLLVAAVTALIATIAYLPLYRPWQLRWGATADEVDRPFRATRWCRTRPSNATRANTTAAPPDQIWGWLPQVGVKRAGWYSYDRLDNFDRPSARQICHGVPGRIRTCDRPLRRRLLCPLSYGDRGTPMIVRGRVAWHNRSRGDPSDREPRAST